MGRQVDGREAEEGAVEFFRSSGSYVSAIGLVVSVLDGNMLGLLMRNLLTLIIEIGLIHMQLCYPAACSGDEPTYAKNEQTTLAAHDSHLRGRKR